MSQFPPAPPPNRKGVAIAVGAGVLVLLAGIFAVTAFVGPGVPDRRRLASGPRNDSSSEDTVIADLSDTDGTHAGRLRATLRDGGWCIETLELY